MSLPIKRFVELLDKAIMDCDRAARDARELDKQGIEGSALMAKSRFELFRSKVLAGTFEKYNGALLGITRDLSEWAPSYLYQSGNAVEEFFINFWK